MLFVADVPKDEGTISLKKLYEEDITMKLDDSILNKLTERVELLDAESVTTFSVINKLKDMYIDIIQNGYVSDETYLDLAAVVLYSGFVMED